MCDEAANGILIGREEARAALVRAAAAARSGQGVFVLLAGEAGIGKTSLVRHALACSELRLDGSSYDGITLPYGPLVAALRAYQQRMPGHSPARGPLRQALALLVPDPSQPVDAGRAAFFDAIRDALTAIARQQPVTLFLDDLQWADSATLDLLPALGDALAAEAIFLIGAYRHDEIPRDHALRRLRAALRRTGRLQEINLAPLDIAQTALLIEHVCGMPPSMALSQAIYGRTGGLPFFVEEVARALQQTGRVSAGRTGLDLNPSSDPALPLPESVRDAVLLRMRGLSPAAQRTIEVAAVAGLECDLDLVAALAGGEAGLLELLEHGLVVEFVPGRATFRHALVRDAVYATVPWMRRRAMHREVAAFLEASGAPAAQVAEHWLAGHDPDHARPALLAAAEASCRVHAYREAACAYRRALESWPASATEPERLDVLERLAHCAECAGDLSAAMGVWGEAADGWRRAVVPARVAGAERRLAGVYELQGDWERALDARGAAAAAFAASGAIGEAATQRLLAAAHLRSAAHFHAALTMLDTARVEAAQAGHLDVQARILGLEGNVRARLGQGTEGLALVRRGLSLALAHNLSGAASEIYQRLADTLEHSGDYRGAQETYGTAAAFCQTHQAPTTERLCLACLTMVLRTTGDWEHAMTVSRSVLAAPEQSSPHARAVASGVLGSLYALQGQARPARPLLHESAAMAHQIELAAMELDSTWGLAVLDDLTGAYTSGLARCRALLDRWERTEERHYVVAALRWATTFCVERSAGDEARACAAALARIATATSQVDALAALAHALGETALLDGDAAGAVAQFDHALALLEERPLPYERAQSARRAGLALLQTGQRDTGIARLVAAYRTARKLGAGPLAMRIARDLAAQGEPVERRLGGGAGVRLRQGGLSRREVEVLRLVASGHTSREIAATLFLSPRTVEMHVDHLLAKLDCKTRAEAVRKATTLGVLE